MWVPVVQGGFEMTQVQRRELVVVAARLAHAIRSGDVDAIEECQRAAAVLERRTARRHGVRWAA